MSNNFNTSTDGVDIEVQVFLDTFMSQNDYAENFEVVQRGHRGDARILLYTEWGTYPKLDEAELKEVNEKLTLKKNLLEVVLDDTDVEHWYTKTEIRGMNKAELIEQVNLYYLDDMSLDEAMEWADDHSIFIKADGYEKMVSRGYSQGDYVEVLVPDECVNGGAEEMQKAIDNLLWDCPIVVSVTIDDELLEGYDLLNDSYRYERDEIVDNIKAIFIEHERCDYITETIGDLLPEHPEYN